MKTSEQPIRIMLTVKVTTLLVLSSLSQLIAQQELSYGSQIKRPRYFGYELAVKMQSLSIKSNIPQLKDLVVNSEGASLGVKYANMYSAIRGYAGLYYSDGSVPYLFSMMETGITNNFYFLRTRKGTYHTFEPYSLLSLAFQRTSFFGTYLNNQTAGSTDEDPRLGSIAWINGAAGVGVEYQFENDKMQFVHFFAEAKYGTQLINRSSNVALSKTSVTGPLTLSIGVSFGKFK